ncbi:MAG: ATP-binding protein [Syntrophales bacterium]|nr:ATP-binding protein [Syntrophales bacterium]
MERTKLSKYIMPLTLFLVVAVFIVLILIMGFMDLRRLDSTLVGFMQNRGLDIVKTIENVAQEDLDFLRLTLKENRSERRISPIPLSDKEFSIQESLVKALVDVARAIDLKWHQKDLSEQSLKEIAALEKLSIIAIFDEQGEIVLQNRKFDESFAEKSDSMKSAQEKIMIDLFDRLGNLGEMGYIALKRKDGSGTILIALDAEKLKYWGTKIAVIKVIEEIGWEQELAYLTVADNDGKVLGTVGKLPQEHQERSRIVTDEILSGRLDILSRKLRHKDADFLDIIAPLHLDSSVIGYARLGLKWDRARAILAENRNRMIISTILIILIGIMSITALYQNQSRHLARMDEMEKKLRRAERLSALGQLAAGVAHEIRNPLNAVSIASQRLQREYAPANEEEKKEFYRITGIIREEIRRLNNIIEEFVTFFRIRKMELKSHPLEEVILKIANLVEGEFKSRNIDLKTYLNGHNLRVMMDSDKLTQAFHNLLKNAMESIPASGIISISVDPVNGDRLAVRISDTGTGLTEEEIEQIFNPEYTTKEKGLGLGLTLAHEIIQSHKGEISVTSRKGSGTTFEIILPRDHEDSKEFQES